MKAQGYPPFSRKKTALLFFCDFLGFVGILFLFLSSVSARGQSTNIADLYRQIGFNPSATNCGVLVQATDIHMAADSSLLAQGMIVTNLDPRLVSMINGISPRPTAMI